LITSVAVVCQPPFISNTLKASGIITTQPIEDDILRLAQKWARSHADVFVGEWLVVPPNPADRCTACKQAEPSFDDEAKTQHVFKAVRSPLAVQEQIEAGIGLCHAEHVTKWPFQ
jgi:hypothetical protein